VPTGHLGVARLKGFWSRHRTGQTDVAEWVRDNTLLAGLGVGLRETIDYLLHTKPSLEDFESWILRRDRCGANQSSPTPRQSRNASESAARQAMPRSESMPSK
jgi:hypothetical protein